MKTANLPAADVLIPCRIGCAACCIVISISSAMPGHPAGKPAGVRCAHLSSDNRCELFGRPDRPEICVRFRASLEQCGERDEDAYEHLSWLESATT